MILMVIVKILTNAKLEHIPVRLRKIATIKYHYINVRVTLATLMTRMVTVLTSTSVLTVFTTVIQMLSVSIAKAVIHVVAILDIAIWLTIVLSPTLKKVENVYKLMNVVKTLTTVTSMQIVLTKMAHSAANVNEDMMVMVLHVMILTNVLTICTHAIIMQFVSIH